MVSRVSICFSLQIRLIILLIYQLSFTALQSGQVGLIILSSISLIEICQSFLRQSVELEHQMASAKRIIEYTKLPSEPPLKSDDKNTPPKKWPQFGNIEFESLNVRDGKNDQQILRNLTLQIDAKVLIFSFKKISI